MIVQGQELTKNGKTYLVVDVLHVNKKEYVLLSVEENKVECNFYEVRYLSTKEIDFEEVIDFKIKKQLFEAFLSK